MLARAHFPHLNRNNVTKTSCWRYLGTLLSKSGWLVESFGISHHCKAIGIKPCGIKPFGKVHLGKPFGKALWESPFRKPFWGNPFGKALWESPLGKPFRKALWESPLKKAIFTQSPLGLCPPRYIPRAMLPNQSKCHGEFTHGGKYPGCLCHTTAVVKLYLDYFEDHRRI